MAPGALTAYRLSESASGKTPYLVFAAILFALGIFLDCGAEVSIGGFLVNFSQPDIGGLAEQAGARYVSCHWSGAMAGRFAGA